MAISRILALDKWARLLKTIKKNGGVTASLYKLYRMDTLKEGELMGTDCFGNKYYENPRYMFSRNRWVEYNPLFGIEYDASQVTPEWFGWLHYKTDAVPCNDWAKYCLWTSSLASRWLLPASENMTATVKAYYPYSTSRPKIQVWDGQSLCSR